jgi:hypothetical protein
MATALFVLLWWAALFGWWVVMVGTNAGVELVAAACGAVLAAFLAAALRRQGLLAYRFEAAWLASTPRALWKVVQELLVVLWSLVLHLLGVRRLSGTYRAFPFPAGGDDPVSAGRRALAVETDALSPNTLPLDIDCERGLALRHELDARRTSNDLP